MSLKILHTADVHLGLKFAQFSDLKTDLVEARLNTLQQLVETACFLSLRRRLPMIELLVVVDEYRLTGTNDVEATGLYGGMDVLTCTPLKRCYFRGG